MSLWFLVALLVLMLIAALVAVETKDLLSSVVSLGAVGFGVAVAFLFLAAPDLAIVQVVVEVVALVILVRATVSRNAVSPSGGRRWFGLVVATSLVAVLLLAGSRVLKTLPPFGNPVMARIEGTPSTEYLKDASAMGTGRRAVTGAGAANIVTAIVLDYRGYDTLGEATVLFASILGALVVLRRQARRKPEVGS
jgi:multisubunit Na+/H+ antiporter MnhB subunit